MAPKVEPKKAPAAALPGGAHAPGAGPSTAANAAAEAAALEEQRIADARSTFFESIAAESVAKEVSQVLVERASDLYLEVTYDRLSMDYVVLGLWDAMTSAVARANVQPDGAPTLLNLNDAGAVDAAHGAKLVTPPPAAPAPHGSFTDASKPSAGTASSDAVASGAAKDKGGAKKPARPNRAVRITGANQTPSLTSQSDGGIKSPILVPLADPALDPSMGTDLTLILSASGAPSPPTWNADTEPTPIPCDQHTRHNIALRRKPAAAPSATAEAARDDRPSSQRRRRVRDPSQPMSASGIGGVLSDAGGSRPQSRTSSVNSAVPGLGTTQRPVASPSGAAQGRKGRGMSIVPSTPAAGAADAPAVTAIALPPATEMLSAEEQAMLQEVAAAEERKQNALRVAQTISAALADSKTIEKGFIVDSLTGRVVPIVPPEEMLQGAKRLAEPLKFTVPETSLAGQTPQQSTAGPPAGSPRSGAADKKPKGSILRRDENFFIPDLTAVAMVQPVTPVGGVAVKDSDGAPRSSELKAPKNKMSRQEYNSVVKAQTAATGTGTPTEASLEGGLPPPPMRLQPATARSAAPAAPSNATSNNAAAASKEAPTLTPRPPATAGGTKGAAAVQRQPPPSSAPQSVSRRLPLTPASGTAAGASPSRKAQARTAADKHLLDANRKPSVTAGTAVKEFLHSDD